MSRFFFLEKEANNFRYKNGYNNQESINLHSFLLKLKVLTYFKGLNKSISGLALKEDNYHFILVNSNHPIGRQNFTICHELYHLFIQSSFSNQPCYFDPKNNTKEDKNADIFAIFLLMPRDGIFELIPNSEFKKNKLELRTIIKIEQYYQCSRSATIFRLCDLGLIDFEKYEKFKKNVTKSAKTFGYNDELYKPGNEGKFIGDYGEIAQKLFQNGNISESKYITLLSDIGIEIDSILNDNDNEFN